jgi:hypothetical protein
MEPDSLGRLRPNRRGRAALRFLDMGLSASADYRDGGLSTGFFAEGASVEAVSRSGGAVTTVYAPW